MDGDCKYDRGGQMFCNCLISQWLKVDLITFSRLHTWNSTDTSTTLILEVRVFFLSFSTLTLQILSVLDTLTSQGALGQRFVAGAPSLHGSFIISPGTHKPPSSLMSNLIY